MPNRRHALISTFLALPFAAMLRRADAHAPAAAVSPSPVQRQPLFGVEFRTGPAWDSTKPPHEQAFFKDHSSNLKRLRDAGHLLVGARYSDKGLIVLSAADETAARALVDADPSIANGVFVYAIHPFRVFYPGCLAAPER